MVSVGVNVRDSVKETPVEVSTEVFIVVVSVGAGVSEIAADGSAKGIIEVRADVPDTAEEKATDGSKEMSLEILSLGACVPEKSADGSKERSVDVISVRVGELVLVGESMSDSVEEIIEDGSTHEGMIV